MVLTGFNHMLALSCLLIWGLADGDGLMHIFQLAGAINRGTFALFSLVSPAESLNFLHGSGSIPRGQASVCKHLKSLACITFADVPVGHRKSHGQAYSLCESELSEGTVSGSHDPLRGH